MTSRLVPTPGSTHRDVNAARRKITRNDLDSRNPASAGQCTKDVVCHIDDARSCKPREDAALHGSDERTLRTEVGRERNDTAGRKQSVHLVRGVGLR